MTQTVYSLGWMLTHIRNGFNTSSGPFEYKTFVEHLWQELARVGVEGVQQWRTPQEQLTNNWLRFNYDNSDSTLRNLTVEAFYYLLQNGYVVPAPSGAQFTNLPQIGGPFIITERGRLWFAGKSAVPEDQNGYMTLLQSVVGANGALDAVIKQYVEEGLIAFAHRAYFAATVMFGAAAEKEMYLIAESIRAALKDPARQKKMQEALVGRSIKILENRINDVLQPLRKSHRDIFEGSDAHLMSFFEAIRVQRNDAVHPTNAPVTEMWIRFLIDGFPNALAKCEQMRTWFSANVASV